MAIICIKQTAALCIYEIICTCLGLWFVARLLWYASGRLGRFHCTQSQSSNTKLQSGVEFHVPQFYL